MEAKETLPDGYMKNSQGHLVPERSVKPIDKARNELVLELVMNSLAVQSQLKRLKIQMMGDIAAFVDLSAEEYNVSLGGKKGNVTLHSYDGRYKVDRQISENIRFDERLQAARQLIDECIIEWVEGSNDNIKTLIDAAWETDRAGNLSVSKILSLRRLDIREEKWRRAMTIIGDSLTVIDSKAYVRLYQRVGDSDQWEPISLDIARL